MTEFPGHVVIDLSAAVAGIALEDGQERAAATLLHGDHVQMTLLRLNSGAVVAEHATAGPTTVHVLSGAVRFQVDGVEVPVMEGGILVMGAGAAHSVEAVTTATLLLTILRRVDPGPGAP